MNTFLISNSFKKTAKCLDYKRLNKQIVEGTQIIDVMLVKTGLVKSEKKGWHNHPVFKIWQDKDTKKFYIYQLIDYIDEMYKEWIRRGYKNNTWLDKKKRYLEMIRKNEKLFADKSKKLKWSKEFLDTMKSNLIRKDKSHYSKYFPNIKEIKEKYLWEHSL